MPAKKTRTVKKSKPRRAVTSDSSGGDKLRVYVSPLVERNASREMAELFGADTKFGTWRCLWLELAKAQKKLGLDIKQTQIDQMSKHLDDIDFKSFRRTSNSSERCDKTY